MVGPRINWHSHAIVISIQQEQTLGRNANSSRTWAKFSHQPPPPRHKWTKGYKSLAIIHITQKFVADGSFHKIVGWNHCTSHAIKFESINNQYGDILNLTFSVVDSKVTPVFLGRLFCGCIRGRSSNTISCRPDTGPRLLCNMEHNWAFC